jgi:phosphopantothenoylcysteine decarboxylase/phosphopantothenate--cysteine ligase
MVDVMTLQGKRIVLGVSGGIAAFKAVALARELLARGAELRVVMTSNAARFVGPITFTGLTGRPPVIDLWDPSYAGEVHVELSSWADAMVVAPATANVLARAASGIADDALTATLSCMAAPVLFAPAMHHRMWQARATQRAIEQLARDGARRVGPVHGALASGEQGMGRMSEPGEIADALEGLFGARDLAGMAVLVSAGPTVEDIDPVRFLSNRSSGKMGYAIAARAAARGAQVTLVSGPVSLSPPPGCELLPVRSAREMHAAITGRSASMDAVVMTAAVADYRPLASTEHKLKKSKKLTLELVENPDILLDLGAARSGPKPVLVGFALETQNLLAYARDKLVRKKVDLIVANQASDALGGEQNVATFVLPGGDEPQGSLSKLELADRIWDRVKQLVQPSP